MLQCSQSVKLCTLKEICLCRGLAAQIICDITLRSLIDVSCTFQKLNTVKYKNLSKSNWASCLEFANDIPYEDKTVDTINFWCS